MDTQQQDTRPLTFSFANRLPSIPSVLTVSLDALEIRHPGVKAFLSSSVLTDCPLFIQQIKVNASASNVYVIENMSNIKLVLKVLPKKTSYPDDLLTEKAFTQVSADIFVSPKYIKLDKNFILLPYIGRGNAYLVDSFPTLILEDSFIAVLKRLALLHGASILPQKVAQTTLDRLRLPAARELIEKHQALMSAFQSIERAFSTLDIATSAKPVFIHADIIPSNIVENSKESYLIGWGRYPGQGNPYFDLGAVFAMYALDDEVKLQLIRAHYPNTVSNQLPENDKELLKVLNLFSAIYWFNMAISLVHETKLDPHCIFASQGSNHSNTDFVRKIISQEINLLLPSSQIALANTAFYETQKRIEMYENLTYRHKCSF